MKEYKLTVRQIETLRHIHTFISNNGLPPSISDLRQAMGLSSDQGVIEILQRLEDRGMIEKRTPGQARGLRLSADACLAIGVPVPQSATRSGPPAGVQFELNAKQKCIFKRLADIDPKLARMYEGGLRVLLDATNPERIALSAHSIRESTHHLSNMGKDLLTKEETKAASDLKVSNARQLEKLFDPLGGVRHFDQTVYDTWNREFHSFFVEVSHHGREVSVDEYLTKLANFEEFLNRYVLPLQTEIYALLDEQLSKGPEAATVAELRFLLSRNVESYRYFFRKADSRWLAFLNCHGLLFPQWETADYLARIASTMSEEVMAVIESIKTSKDDCLVRRSFIEAAMTMPPPVASRLIGKIAQEDWVVEPCADWLAHSFTDLLAMFIDCNRHKDALRLAALLLQGKDRSETDIKSYRLEQLLDRFSAVPASELSPYIGLLVHSLGTRIASEHRGGDDGSLMWRSAIEDHDQNWHPGDAKDHLVTALRGALSRYIEHLLTLGSQSLQDVLDNLLNWNPSYSIFTRLRLHIYRQNAALFMPAIETAIEKEFERTNAWHEYYLLLREQFPQLNNTIRSRYFELIDQGPKGEHGEGYVRNWKARKLAAVIDYLTPAEQARFQEFLPTAERTEHPDFLAYGGASWVGPTSPLTEANLATMPVDAIIERLVSWQPSNDWFSPSREGLGRTLSALVAKDAESFSKSARRFGDPRIQPVYIYHLLLGLEEGLKGKAQLDWQSILDLALALVERSISGRLPAFEAINADAVWETEWNGTFQEIGTLLQAGLQDNIVGVAFDSRREIWRIVEFLCEHADPTPEYEEKYGGNNMEPITLSINTVRGRAFHALFAYIFWCDRRLGGKAEHGSRIPYECRSVLEFHLDPARDPSLTVRSVYGHFFPWLFIYDPPWATGLIERLFPTKELERRYAAWETYLANGVFPKLYAVLKPQYEQAISEVRKFKSTRRYWADPIERLADHMMVAYAYRAEEDKGATWTKFFRMASAKQRGKAVSFGGRAYVLKEARSGEQPPDTSRLQEFWEWRLADSRDREELQEFGWWVKSGRFNDGWMLERLSETLRKTDGAIAADMYVLGALSALAFSYPLLCGNALLLIVKSRYTDRWMLGSSKEIQSVLVTLYGNVAVEIKDLAASIVDHLTKLGFESYRHTLENSERALLTATPESLRDGPN